MTSAAESYHKWYYNNNLWLHTKWRGVICHKSVMDMWNYQELIHRFGLGLVVETGVKFGGSALFFAEHVPYVGMDISDKYLDPRVTRHPQVTFYKGDSSSREMWDLAKTHRSGSPSFVLLDSDHTREHVYKELTALEGFVEKGDLVVVEDTNINGNPVLPDFGPGPMEAVEEFLADHPGRYRRTDLDKRFGWSFAPAGFLERQ